MRRTTNKPKPAPARRWRRLFFPVLGATVAVAFLLRLGVGMQLLQSYSPVSRPAPATDMYTYQKLAEEILAGSYDYSRGFYYQPFYYAVFLPVVYRVFGSGATGVILAQALLGAGCVWLVGLSFARLFGRAAGLAGAALLALACFHIFYTPFTLIAVLQSFWLSLFLYLSVLAWYRRRLRLWALAGLVLGLSVVTRGNTIFLLPLALILVIWQLRKERGKMVAGALLVLVFTLLPQLPFAYVNYGVFGRWIGPSSAGAVVLALGNTPEAPPGGRDPEAGAGPMEYPQSYREWARLDSLDGPRRVPVYLSMWRWFKAEPIAYLELKFRMLLLFWNRMEIPNNIAIKSWNLRTGRLEPVRSSLLRLPLLLDFLILGSLGLTGMLLALRHAWRKPGVLFAIATVTIYCLSIVLFYVLARFRIPVVPLLCGFGGYAVALLFRQYRCLRRSKESKKARALLYSLLLVLLCLAFVGFGYDAYRHGCEAAVMRLVRPNGVRVELRDRYTIKDNGPQSIGGWVPAEVPAGVSPMVVQKSFVPWKDIQAKGPFSIRLAVFAEQPGAITIKSGQTTAEGIEVRPGLQWIEHCLHPGQYKVLHNQLRRGEPLELVVSLIREGNERIYCFFDSQRDYGRTGVNDEQSAGEMVIELNVLKDEEATPHRGGITDMEE